MDEHLREGRRVYYQNCLPCHGDRLDGEGHFGHGFSPTPLLQHPGTIAQLKSFVFWRIAKGGPGLRGGRAVELGHARVGELPHRGRIWAGSFPV
jgi:hypothetical protein